jgi:hypothetical protein
LAALRRAHLWSDLDRSDQDEISNGHRATPDGCPLGRSPDLRCGDTAGLKAAVARELGQLGRLDVVLTNVGDAVSSYPEAAQSPEMGTVLLSGAEVIDGPDQRPPESNECNWGVSKPACVDCGQSFHPDSSPHMDRCWACAERDDEESYR